jgi:hypothetical protein
MTLTTGKTGLGNRQVKIGESHSVQAVMAGQGEVISEAKFLISDASEHYS